jgi:hypothetical protein
VKRKVTQRPDAMHVALVVCVLIVTDKNAVALCDEMNQEGDVGEMDESLLGKKVPGRPQKKV